MYLYFEKALFGALLFCVPVYVCAYVYLFVYVGVHTYV